MKALELRAERLQQVLNNKQQEVDFLNEKVKKYEESQENLEKQKDLAEKYKDSFEKIEERIGQVILENEKLNCYVQDKENELQSYQEKL
jgi:hypothetical protein